MQRLKRVFSIDIAICEQCGGKVKVIACIESPDVIQKILTHLYGKMTDEKPVSLPKTRAAPQFDLFC